MKSTETIFIGLGSNVGQRMSYLKKSLAAMAKQVGRLKKCSPVYETSSVGPPQRDFLNAVVKLETSLSPMHVLKQLKNIEKNLGRQRRRRWGPREIDLDFLFHGQSKIKKKGLIVPHPRWNQRKFVLWPLSNIASRFVDPISGQRVGVWKGRLTDPDQRIKLFRSTIK